MFFKTIPCKIKKRMFIKNTKGQIAIFVVLIFQVLFILFAMTINVGLVVHDKINLQNSLDLAVYYGAKKQAEVLNAMAHINYQMRQNWKLLAWRYRILGTLTQDYGFQQVSPFTCPSPPVASPLPYWCPQNTDCKINCTLSGITSAPSRNDCQNANSLLGYGNYCDSKYFICISSDLWKRGINTNGVNICKTIGYVIPPIENLPIVAPFLVEAHIVAGISNLLQADVIASCNKEGALNWLMAQFFLTHFRLDQRDRKVMLRQIYEKSLKEGLDLDGKSIFEGAKKVFINNLSQANKDSFEDSDLQELNSFKGLEFEDIFEQFKTAPILQYWDSDNSGSVNCSSYTAAHYSKSLATQRAKLATHSLHSALNATYIRYLFSFNEQIRFFNFEVNIAEDKQNPIASLTLGFSKKPDPVLYYALKVELDYSPRIFSLNQIIPFKASAFAKAFGGRFGPSVSDPLIPTNSTQIPNINHFLLQPNHSRWPGDPWGLLDTKLHDNVRGESFLKKHNADPADGVDSKLFYSMEDFFHLIFFPTADDPLARPPLNYTSPAINPMAFMRLMELMAVYPDAYDLSYYSISSNYMKTYFPKICKLLLGGGDCPPGPNARYPISSVPFSAYIRGDFGWPDTEFYINRNQDKKQVDISIAPYFLNTKSPIIDTTDIKTGIRGEPPTNISWLTSSNIFYKWLAQDLPGYLLSSWTPTTDKNRYAEYKFPDSNFLKCHKPALKGKPVPSSCVKGGRSDYSVKLISCETVNNFPPETKKPSPINEYCP